VAKGDNFPGQHAASGATSTSINRPCQAIHIRFIDLRSSSPLLCFVRYSFKSGLFIDSPLEDRRITVLGTRRLPRQSSEFSSSPIAAQRRPTSCHFLEIMEFESLSLFMSERGKNAAESCHNEAAERNDGIILFQTLSSCFSLRSLESLCKGENSKAHVSDFRPKIFCPASTISTHPIWNGIFENEVKASFVLWRTAIDMRLLKPSQQRLRL
jgi:hypothetical protein